MTNNDAHSGDANMMVESRSLTIGKWGNLFMAISGVTVAWLSRSDALLIDGLYSAVNFLSAIVAARVGLSVQRAPDPSRPFGYEADEALYVTFRSMILVGLLGFAFFTSANKILIYAAGGEVPELKFGPIQVYVILMVVICAMIAIVHHRSWVKTGKKSALLLAERSSAIADGAMSAGAGIALLSVPFLTGTALEFLVPIADAIVVVVMIAIIITQPISAFMGALGEISGKGADKPVVAELRKKLQELDAFSNIEILDLGVSKLGRRHSILCYIKPDEPMTAAKADLLRNTITDVGAPLLGESRTEVILTEHKRYAAE